MSTPPDGSADDTTILYSHVNIYGEIPAWQFYCKDFTVYSDFRNFEQFTVYSNFMVISL